MKIKNKKYDVVVAGYTCIDLTPKFRQGENSSITEIFKPGQLTEIEGITFLAGGVVPNTGMALKKFNAKVYMNGLIGKDSMGTALMEWLNKYDYAEGMKFTDDEETAFAIVLAPPGVDRIFLESPGCNKIFNFHHINYQAVSESKIFHFGYPALLQQFYKNGGSQLESMFAKVQESGTVTSLDFTVLDPNSEAGKLDWNKILSKVLPNVDICTPSVEEAMQMIMPDKYKKLLSESKGDDIVNKISNDDIREIGMKMISYGTKIVLIKAAHKGVYLFTTSISSNDDRLSSLLDTEKWSNCALKCNAYKVDENLVKNSTGAGDTAIAGFLTAILKGFSPSVSLKYASLAGRNNLYCDNIYEELPTWLDMTKEVEKETEMVINLNEK